MRLSGYSIFLKGGLFALLVAMAIFATGAEISPWVLLCFALPAISNGAKQVKRERLIDLESDQYTILKRVIESCVPYNEVWAYGSRVNWKASEKSDLDLVVIGSDWETIATLREALEESDLLISVDVMNWETIPDDFKANIKRKYVVVQKPFIPKGWRQVILGEFVDVKHGYAFKGTDITKEPNENILVTPGNFHIGGGFKTSKFKYFHGRIPQDYVLDTDDIVVTMTDLSKDGDTLGYVAKIPQTLSKQYLHNQRIGLVILKSDSDEVYRDFIYWLMRTKSYHSFIVGAASGMAIKHTSPTTIRAYHFLLPSPPEQKTIAEVLSSLEEKIDLLHQQNKTLESMAQTLFRKWFIKDIQPNWEKVFLGDFFPILTGKRNVHYSTEDGEYAFFTCSQNMLKAPGYSFDGKAILLAGNGYFNVKRYEGKFDAYQRTYVLIPHEEKYFNFLYLLMKHFLRHITGGAQGSVIQFITMGMITGFSFALPKENFDEKLEKFDHLYAKIDTNQSQISTLEKTRDMILPKLMNGAIEVN